ncbi:hypothetical protein SYJ56_22545 [Algoriphagus sp. D3-2-R+10]|uniref:hypothetical protein n=1 Tax=Algoriphagus aurantiacus TaxID=3103948 RepID=UPI002B3E2382|nr:hypothetical protein [Algoriphagus sp. D3-2-R+10]MEB2778110.1 hypothetical protein [Algoriphagus sp. D3-2-R+10]
MKHIKLLKFQIVMAGIIVYSLTSCQDTSELNPIDEMKTEQIQPDLSSGILHFKDKEEFSDYLASSDKSSDLNFYSLAMALGEFNTSKNLRTNESKEFIEEFEGSALLEILNEDGMVIIDSSLYFLDFGNKVIAVTQDFSLKDNLLDGKFEDENIKLFSFEDEVLELVEIGSSSTVNSRTLLFCSDRKASGKMEKIDYEYLDAGSQTAHRVETKHGYQKAGIYFSLLTQIKHMSKPNGSALPWSASNTYLHLERYTKFKRRCGSTHEGNTPITESWESKINFRPHEGTKGLARYRIRSTYTFLEKSELGTGDLIDIILPEINDGY